MDPGLTLDAYRAVLGALFGFHQPLEELLLSSGGWRRLGFDPAERQKCGRLRADLSHLGLDDAAVEALPRCRLGGLLEDDAHRLGCIYVVEGATLGGQIIGRRLSEHLGILPQGGGAFMAGYGDATGAMWRAVLGCLEAWSDRTEAEREGVLQGAETTFETLEGWLESRRVLR
jgi:heme oxygenase (biliverdin-IX-beta and delta-forming)